MSRAPLLIDFALSRWRLNSGASIVAAIAGVIAIAATFYVSEVRERTRELNARLSALQRADQRAATRALPTTVITADHARSVNDAVRRLNLEWDKIFAALKGADDAVGKGTGRVALLTLEPDPATGLVKLSAEARSLNAMLGYQKQLENQPDVESAIVTKHEVQLDDPQAPVRFLIEARMRRGSERAQ